MSPASEPTVVLTDADVASFAEASHDRSPIHVSAEYARTTPFGRPVVHGVLGALACLAHLPRAADGSKHVALTRLVMEFKSPVYAGVPYTLAIEPRGERIALRLLEGGRVMQKLSVERTASGDPSAASTDASASGVKMRATAARRTMEELAEGTRLHGEYAAVPSALARLIERFRLDPHSGISARHIEAMMAASYLVGMEAPGEPALLSRVALDFAPPATSSSATAPLTFALHVAERDTRFDLVRMEVAFEREGAAVANAAIDAYVRREPKVVDVAALRRRETPSDRLQGKVALVVGASRGLGAALSVALADQACEVGASFAKSADAAARVAAAVPGRIALLPADAGDAHSFAPAARAFAATHGGLDLLVCNACLPVSAVALHEATVGRIAEYVERSFALAAVPLAATLELLEQRKGMLVMISSSAVREPPPEWPHYVAAKGALEGLARTVAARGRVRVLIARPPRLDTDLMNTPGIPGDALAPEAVAAAIVGAVRAGFEVAPSRAPVVLEDFADFSEA